MFLVKRIIVIMCAKNYKSKFKFVEVIQKKVYSFFQTCNAYVFQELGELGLLYYNCLFVCLPTMLIALVMGEYQRVISAFLLVFLLLFLTHLLILKHGSVRLH